ncbi:MAG TPA: hypothetical protein VFA18_11870, partial [Gemmataceae bacterium]|nr:hypothetical protein [Gemmataceae bacterium]
MEYLCIAFTVLFLIVALGHGVWVLAAWLFRQFGGSTPPRAELPPCPECGRLLLSLERPCRWCGFDPESSTEQSLADLVATTRQLRRFLAAGKIDQTTFDTLRGHILAERRRLRREEPERVPAVVAATATQQAEAPTNGEPPVEVLTLEVDQAVEAPPPPLVRPVPSTPPPAAATPPPFVLTAASVPEPEPPAEPPVITVPEPAAPPRLPRQPLRAMLTAFMEERNILWGELVGGLLIVGCSIALVVSLWPTLNKIPYSPFLIFAGITAALFGAGLYTLHHWKLASTSRGLLIIAALLVPLNFLVLAGLHRPDGGGLIEAGLEVIAVAIFAGLVRQAARVLVPESGWLLPVGVLGCAAVQLLAAWLLPSRPSLAWVLPLGLGAVACQGASVGGLLWRVCSGEPKLEPDRAGRLFLHLGISAFAVLVTLGLLSYGTAQLGTIDLFGAVLDRLAVVVALAGVPVLLTGLQVHTGLAEHEDAGAMRTAGTAVALAGMAVLLGGLALAWPQPLALIAVGGLDFIILTAVAFRWRLPVVHGAALPCLVLTCVTVALLVWQNVGRETLPAALYSADSGVILVGLFLLLGAGGEGLTRFGRRADGFFYVVTAAV